MTTTLKFRKKRKYYIGIENINIDGSFTSPAAQFKSINSIFTQCYMALLNGVAILIFGQIWSFFALITCIGYKY